MPLATYGGEHTFDAPQKRTARATKGRKVSAVSPVVSSRLQQ